jgi:dTDP-4-amino-4,6-dideoxygalactose transaminase
MNQKTTMMKIPFLDLKAQYGTIADEIAAALQKVLDNCAFAGGPFAAQFEREFAAYCQSESAIGVGSGTAALWLALKGLEIGEGDEVITVPNTFIATAEAISVCGARPVFVDIDEQTYNINPELIEAAITPKTKAIIPVHLYGQMAEMDGIMEIARAHGLFVIEDACQAHGAEYKGRRAGSIGDAGCFSFYPGKNLGAYGEAGAVVTNNQELANKIMMLRDHGQKEKYYHSMVGWNCRMDGFQGAVLSVKLKHLDQWNKSRRKSAELYNSLLASLDPIVTPFEADYAKHVYHIYPVLTESRQLLMDALTQKQIFCGIHYPVPLHLQAAYSSLGYKKGDFPVAEKCANKQLSLPMFPELTSVQIKYVVEEIKSFICEQK